MPGAQERILRRRIASTQNMKKITRAMELIAATRVVKAQQAARIRVVHTDQPLASPYPPLPRFQPAVASRP